MPQLPVRHLDGVFCVIGPDNEARPIRLGGEPVRSFQPGWRPRGACNSFAPWTILDLLHESGREASWLLGDRLDYSPLSPSRLPEHERAAIAAQAVPAIRAVYVAMLCATSPSRPDELTLFAGLNRTMIAEILQVAADTAIGATTAISMREQAGAGRAGAIRLDALAAALGGNFQESLRAALVDGSLSCASPVDGRELRSRQSLVLHEHRLAYRFVDERHGLVFFIGTTNHLFAKSDLFIPSINTAFTTPAETRPPHDLARQFLAHAIADATPLLNYLDGRPDAREPRSSAVCCRGFPHLHIGHQLWNELTALDRLVRELPPAQLPTVIVPDAEQGSEIFAPIDRIFPELEGRIDRDLREPETLGEYVYRKGYFLLRALDEHVTLDLARRIRDASAAEEPPIRDDARLAARIAAEQLPCLLFGLRVENRTVTDPAAVIGDCIDHLRARLGRIVVVIDGHNARLHHDPTLHFQSFGQGMHEPPVLAELRLAMQLHHRFQGTEVTIVNLCGASVSRSLFWAARADFFIAFWGAGLAKYRWACNRPGLVLSSKWNLRHREDLHIYDAPRYQEGGAAMRFLDHEAVTDLPDAPVRFAPGDPVPAYSNFQVDLPALREALDGMIAEHLP